MLDRRVRRYAVDHCLATIEKVHVFKPHSGSIAIISVIPDKVVRKEYSRAIEI